ncbi:MAG: hypothetical protein ACPGVU_26695 [Limisphaerales bacterium]
MKDKPGKEAVVERIKELFSTRKEIVEVVDYQARAKGPAMGNPEYAPDLFLVAKPGFVFADEWKVDSFAIKSSQPYGVHGFHPDDPKMFGCFMASGYGIKRGVKLDRMQIIDLAPTIATLLGLELPDVDGRVLKEILSDLNVAESNP